MKKQRIVAIEDEPDLLEVLQYNLSREGYEVLGSKNGEEGLRLVRRAKPDLLLLDLMLPGLDGLEICRRLKRDDATRNIPIIMVTAKGEESDVVLGLELGADDYVVKPFGPRELLARVKAVLRRGEAPTDADAQRPVRTGSLHVDPQRHEVILQGRSIDLTATEFRLLHFLARHPGRVFERQRLVKEVVGEDAYVLERNIDVHIRAIRRKLGDHADLIMTVRGVGYRFRDDGGDASC